MTEEQSNNTTYNKDLYTATARRDRFVRIAEKRTNRILNSIRLLGNTSNKTLYKYEPEDVDKIFASIEQRLAETKAKFKSPKQEKPFKL